MVAFESTLERDFIIQAELDPVVRSIEEQPRPIHYLDSRSRLHFYTPDFLLTYHASGHFCKPPMLTEVKYRDELFDKWAELHPALRAGARYARRHGWTFRVLTECEIRNDRLRNATWLMPYRSIVPLDDHRAALLATMRELGTSTPLALLDRAVGNSEGRPHLISAMWHLIGEGILCADLDTKLTMSSPIWTIQ